MSAVDLVIVDLDDTIWRWCDTWLAGYRAFNDALADYGIDEREAETAWALMYDRLNGGTIEFPPNPGDMSAAGVPTAIAIPAYGYALGESRDARDKALQLFPGVMGTLKELKSNGVTVVAHTDSPVTAAAHRLSQAGLDGLVSELYAAPFFDDFGDSLELIDTKHTHVGGWKSKPDTTVLESIMKSHRAAPSKSLYVGDSLRRDMLMAERAGMVPVWARYGSDYDTRSVALNTLHVVQRMRPYPAEDYVAAPLKAGHTTLSSFDELLDIVL